MGGGVPPGMVRPGWREKTQASGGGGPSDTQLTLRVSSGWAIKPLHAWNSSCLSTWQGIKERQPRIRQAVSSRLPWDKTDSLPTLRSSWSQGGSWQKQVQ